jgi:anti-sigma regulatory factor (Ser/Thr protein kinase)
MTQPAVIAARPKRRTFPGHPGQIGHARGFARRVLERCPALDEAVLLVSELATNALEHTATGAGGFFEITILTAETSLMIAVTDNGAPQMPALGDLNPESETGRGLGLVEVLSHRWGHCGGRHGRTVWFELIWDVS